MKNGGAVVGLFQGMFEKNMLTFNPGWGGDTSELDDYTDVRDLQRAWKGQGVELINESAEATTGPASFIAVDSDENPILIDQHV